MTSAAGTVPQGMLRGRHTPVRYLLSRRGVQYGVPYGTNGTRAGRSEPQQGFTGFDPRQSTHTNQQRRAMHPPAGIVFLSERRDQVTKEWSKVFHVETYAELPPGTRPFIDRIIAMESRTK